MIAGLKRIFAQSPFIITSTLTCSWCVVRGLLYQWKIGPVRPSPFDLPFFHLSPVATEYNLVFTLGLVSLFGMSASIIGLFRKKEALRWWGLLALPLNYFALLWAESMVEWALNPPPGIDY